MSIVACIKLIIRTQYTSVFKLLSVALVQLATLILTRMRISAVRLDAQKPALAPWRKF